MNTRAVFIICLLASIVVAVIGAYLKITHSSGSDVLLILAFVFSLIYIIIGIYEVFSSPRIDKAEKILWTLGFLFMSGITAFLYLLFGRKRVGADPVTY